MAKTKYIQIGKTEAEALGRTSAHRPGRAHVTLGGLAYLLVGVAALALGIVAMTGAAPPQLEGFLTAAAERGATPMVFLLAGVGCMGLGLLARYQRLHTDSLMRDEGTQKTLSAMATDMSSVTSKVVEFQADQLHFRGEIEAARQGMSQLLAADRNSESVQALAQLAQGVEQLGTRIDPGVGQNLLAVSHQVTELTTLVNASRDFLQETLEEQAELIAKGSGQPEAPSSTEDLERRLRRIEDEIEELPRRIERKIAALLETVTPVAPVASVAPSIETPSTLAEPAQPSGMDVLEAMEQEEVPPVQREYVDPLHVLDDSEPELPEENENPLLVFEGADPLAGVESNDDPLSVFDEPPMAGAAEPEPEPRPMPTPAPLPVQEDPPLPSENQLAPGLQLRLPDPE